MRVRVYDKKKNKYFKSEVYAIINKGWYSKYLVVDPCASGLSLKLIDYLDKTNDGPHYPVNINVITPDIPKSWVSYGGDFLLKTKSLLVKTKTDIRFDYFCGYPWIFEDSQLISALLTGKTVYLEDTKLINSYMEDWNYIENPDDSENLLEKFSSFHDSVLKGLSYVSGSSVLPNKNMIPSDSIRQVTMVFDSQWTQSIEMVFEGVVALNLRPAQDNYTSDIYEASIIVKDETIYFYDDYMETPQPEYEGTWIKAFGLRWRFI